MWRPYHRRTELSPLFADAAPPAGQLRLVAQPIVDLVTGEPVAAELIPLVARPPRNGSPVAGCFQAGSAGVVDIDAWVVQRAAYLTAHLGRIHVALSDEAARSETFVARIERAIDRAAGDPRLLAFELDEAFAARETTAAAALAGTLAGFGCPIAIRGCAMRFPDAGHLGRIPADYVKIHPRLVNDVGDDPRAPQAIVAIAHAAATHDLETIAAGVYDEELRSLLRFAGVDYGQGFAAQRHYL